MRPLFIPLTFGLFFLAACGGMGDAQPTPELAPGGTQDISGPPPTTLAAGTLRLPAAAAFGEPGFHETLVATASLPPDLGPTSDHRLIFSLRDVSRPEQTCSQQHPLSGCASVDWSDDPARPNVPPDGVFENRLVLSLSSGAQTLFLHEDGQLAPEPEGFEPG